MNKKCITKILDKISPIMSGVGAFVGYTLLVRYSYLTELFSITQWLISVDYAVFYIYAGVMPALLAYLACTCTHRKLWFYSPGALGGFVGALIGMSVGGVVVPLISEIGCFTFPPVLAIIFSYLFHKHYLGGKSR